MIEIQSGGRILRYEVPVNDEWHTHTLRGPIVYVGARDPGVVEFWAADNGGCESDRQFRVFGTGHQLPDARIAHHGSVIVADGALVWHLIEREPSRIVVLDGAN